MKRERINYAEIDIGVQDLVRGMNRIPFVATQSSCEGHLLYSSRYGLVPDEGCAFLTSGHVIFRLDRRYGAYRRFLEEVGSLTRKYSFVDLSEHNCGKQGCQTEGSITLNLYHHDLTQPEPIVSTDNFETMFKKRWQVTIGAGSKRVEQFREVWSDLLGVVQRY